MATNMEIALPPPSVKSTAPWSSGGGAKISGGIAWAGVSQAVRLLLQLAGLALLSRLLPPVDFGLVAMASVVTNFANLIKDMGTSAAVIQRQQVDDMLLNTVFWFNAAIGLTLGLAVLALSVPMALVFHQPRLNGVLIALSPSFPIACISSVHQALMERAMEFRRLAYIEISSSVLALAASIASALHGAGVYSLVINTLVMATATSILLSVSSRWIPRWSWSLDELKDIWRFSGNLVSFQIVNYFARNADSMLIGRFLGPQDLGWYNMAYRLMLFPLQNLSGVVARALFPVLSRQQQEPAAVGHLYLRTVAGVAVVTAPLMVALMVLRTDVIQVFLGDQWTPVADVFIWLAPVGLIQSLLSTVGLLYMATGSTRVMMKWGWCASLVYVLGISIGLHWGYLGVAAGYALANAILAIPGFVVPLRIVGLRFGQLVQSVRSQILSAVAMGVVVWIARMWLFGNMSSPLQLACSCALGIFAYSIIGFFLMPAATFEQVPGLTKVHRLMKRGSVEQSR